MVVLAVWGTLSLIGMAHSLASHPNSNQRNNNMPPPTGPMIPLFLRKCDKVPTIADECSSEKTYEYHRYRGRTFELAVNLETLLVTENAGELLFEVAGQNDIIIWLSDHFYITDDCIWCHECRIDYLTIWVGQNKFDWKAVDFCICHMPSSNASEQGSTLATSDAVTDTLLRLLAKHKSIQFITMQRPSDFDATEPFPVLPSTLKTLVSEAQSPREVCFDYAGLSIEQWRALAFNCNQNVELYDISGTFKDFKIAALSEAMHRNQCPAKMELHFVDEKLSEDIFQGFCAALASTNSLKELRLHTKAKECLISLCTGISQNHGLETLELLNYGQWTSLSDEEWELLCSVLGSHPTLKTIEARYFSLEYPSRSPERDDIFIRHISKNKVLCKLDFECFVCFSDFYRVQRAFSPVLKMNRFQSKDESDQTRR